MDGSRARARWAPPGSRWIGNERVSRAGPIRAGVVMRRRSGRRCAVLARGGSDGPSAIAVAGSRTVSSLRDLGRGGADGLRRWGKVSSTRSGRAGDAASASGLCCSGTAQSVRGEATAVGVRADEVLLDGASTGWVDRSLAAPRLRTPRCGRWSAGGARRRRASGWRSGLKPGRERTLLGHVAPTDPGDGDSGRSTPNSRAEVMRGSPGATPPPLTGSPSSRSRTSSGPPPPPARRRPRARARCGSATRSRRR